MLYENPDMIKYHIKQHQQNIRYYETKDMDDWANMERFFLSKALQRLAQLSQ